MTASTLKRFLKPQGFDEQIRTIEILARFIVVCAVIQCAAILYLLLQRL